MSFQIGHFFRRKHPFVISRENLWIETTGRVPTGIHTQAPRQRLFEQTVAVVREHKPLSA